MITVFGNEIKISQYADDTIMILDGSKKSFTSALLDLELFGEISGLKQQKHRNTELKERFDVKTNFLVYHGLVSCIKFLRL